MGRLAKGLRRRGIPVGSDQLDELLPKVLATEKSREGFGCVGQSLHDGFPIPDLTARNALAQLFSYLGPHPHVIRDDEALDLQTIHQDGSHSGVGVG